MGCDAHLLWVAMYITLSFPAAKVKREMGSVTQLSVHEVKNTPLLSTADSSSSQDQLGLAWPLAREPRHGVYMM